MRDSISSRAMSRKSSRARSKTCVLGQIARCCVSFPSSVAQLHPGAGRAIPDDSRCVVESYGFTDMSPQGCSQTCVCERWRMYTRPVAADPRVDGQDNNTISRPVGRCDRNRNVCAMIPHFGCGSKGMSVYTSFTVMIICYYSGVAIRRRVSA